MMGVARAVLRVGIAKKGRVIVMDDMVRVFGYAKCADHLVVLA